jgi:hypothetical protein
VENSSVPLLVFLTLATPAFAQHKEKIPPFVIDARAAIGLLKQSASTAASLGDLTGQSIATTDLPSHGLGLSSGVQFYPLRRAGFALGLGGELLLVSASHQATDANNTPTGPAVERRLQNLSAQISLNFGHRDGWSYITGGIGPLAFDTYAKDAMPDGLRPMTINFGAGARWFSSDHVAFTFDLRFYQTMPADPTLVVAKRDRQPVMVFSAGISIR